MAGIALALGSNLGDRLKNLRDAVSCLDKFLRVKAKSFVYETEPWGVLDQPKFLNACILCEAKDNYNLEPLELLKSVKDIERELGREKNIRWGARKIDIDILFIDDLIINLENLKIPHENLHNRGFVLVPLCDIAPAWVHPVIKKSASELLKLNHDDAPLKFAEL